MTILSLALLATSFAGVEGKGKKPKKPKLEPGMYVEFNTTKGIIIAFVGVLDPCAVNSDIVVEAYRPATQHRNNKIFSCRLSFGRFGSLLCTRRMCPYREPA